MFRDFFLSSSFQVVQEWLLTSEAAATLHEKSNWKSRRRSMSRSFSQKTKETVEVVHSTPMEQFRETDSSSDVVGYGMVSQSKTSFCDRAGWSRRHRRVCFGVSHDASWCARRVRLFRGGRT